MLGQISTTQTRRPAGAFAIALAGALATSACGSLESNDSSGTSTAVEPIVIPNPFRNPPPLMYFSLQGYTGSDPAPGDSFNAYDATNSCVWFNGGVLGAFASLPTSPSGRVRYRSEGGQVLQPFNYELYPFGTCLDASETWHNHVQGVGRLTTDDGDDRWFVMSRARPGNIAGAGIFLAQMGDIPANGGERLVARGADYSGSPPSNRRTWYYYSIGYTDHPGGLQTIGGLAAVASEGSQFTPTPYSPFIDFYDFRSPGSQTALIQRMFLDGSHGEPFADTQDSGFLGQPSGVGITRLNDGHYLLFVLGKDSKRSGWFFVSKDASLTASTQWTYLAAVSWPNDGEFQNANFITDCADGQIYLLMTNNTDYSAPCAFSDCLSAGTNQATLYKVGISGLANHVVLTFMDLLDFSNDNDTDGYAQFRAAANAYVTPENNLIMYSHAHHSNTDIAGCPDSKLKLSEYAY